MRQHFHPTILQFDSLPSTNTEAARQAAAGADEGLCVVAREQTAGRGRRERAWVSPLDAGLYLSVVLRPQLEASAWSLITLAASLAVRDALKEACALATDIKWSNDLMARGRKLCGILAETVETTRGRACVVGIGVNLNAQAFPPEIDTRATSIEAETGRAPERDTLLAAMLRQLARQYERLHEPHGRERVLADWRAASSYAEGKRVRVALGDDEMIEGTTRGLESDGALRVETDTGEMKIVRAGDVVALRQREDESMAG